jgi:hypothetical protein
MYTHFQNQYNTTSHPSRGNGGAKLDYVVIKLCHVEKRMYLTGPLSKAIVLFKLESLTCFCVPFVIR